jgi:hypothetical protein
MTNRGRCVKFTRGRPLFMGGLDRIIENKDSNNFLVQL